MPKPRKDKKKADDVSNTDTPLDEPSTSTQPMRRTSSRRKASPFRGFDGDVDQKNLCVMNRILKTTRGGGGDESQEKVLEDVLKAKKSRICSPKPVKSKEEKRSTRPKKGISSDLNNQIKKELNKFKKQNKDNFKVVTKKYKTDDSRSNRDFLSAESKHGNFVNIFNNLQTGSIKQSALDEVAENVALKNIRWFKVFGRHEVPDLRITALTWHPTNSCLAITGGKAGTLILYKTDEEKSTFHAYDEKMFLGVGPGGTMENIRFNPTSSGIEVYTASVDGTIAWYNFDSFTRKFLFRSPDPCRVWFCGVDVHQDGKSVYGGDSNGNVAIHRLDSGKTEYGTKTLRLHSSKIRHLEFNSRDPNLLVTSSLDKKVKVWDIRKLSENNSFIVNLEHSTGVSAAKFSRTDGCRLLTTDIYSEIRVFKAPFWMLEHKISHPHRHYQHLTLIRASWHPQADVFVVGRYPHPKFEDTYDDIRCLDVFSASTGRLCCELTDTSKLITSLAELNSTGSCVASSSGKTVFFWKEQRRI